VVGAYKRWLCRLLGHRWVGCELKYEYGRKVWAYSGGSSEPVEIEATFVCDEVCARCGAETWWPA
jgi:hypothetical protein